MKEPSGGRIRIFRATPKNFFLIKPAWVLRKKFGFLAKITDISKDILVLPILCNLQNVSSLLHQKTKYDAMLVYRENSDLVILVIPWLLCFKESEYPGMEIITLKRNKI